MASGLPPQASSGAHLDPGPPLPASTRWTGLAVVTTLFFMWGFITCLNDILVPHLKTVFRLNYVQASLIQLIFFGAYMIVSLPAGKVIAVVGYQKAMVIGLVTCGIGTLLFYPAAGLLSYPFFLGALFVLAGGITILQVAANPYISVLGRPETASTRLTLAQAFNSLGTTIAPFLGGWLILGHISSTSHASAAAQADAVKGPYLGLTALLLLLAVALAFFKLPRIPAVEEDAAHPGSFRQALLRPNLSLGAIGIFLYVGAEVAIGSYLINFLGDPAVAGLSPRRAADFVSYYWGGAMIGRFLGSGLMRIIRPNRLLALNAALAAFLAASGFLASGGIAMWAVIAIGFFNSIMFPTIFTLGIAELGHLTDRGSSVLILAIVGGAVVPVIMGRTADLVGVHHAFFIPALCYLYIIYYGMSGYRPGTAAGSEA